MLSSRMELLGSGDTRGGSAQRGSVEGLAQDYALQSHRWRVKGLDHDWREKNVHVVVMAGYTGDRGGGRGNTRGGWEVLARRRVLPWF